MSASMYFSNYFTFLEEARNLTQGPLTSDDRVSKNTAITKYALDHLYRNHQISHRDRPLILAAWLEAEVYYYKRF